jgi:YHS domain-containing protein
MMFQTESHCIVGMLFFHHLNQLSMRTAILAIMISIFSGCSTGDNKVYTTSDGAIDGYDVVAFFTDSKPVKGQEAYSCDYQGRTWHFADREHLSMFLKSPQKYVPAFGGYCAYGVAQGKRNPGNPNAWSIVNGKLYLNYNHELKNQWYKRRQEFIRQAEKKWEETDSITVNK